MAILILSENPLISRLLTEALEQSGFDITQDANKAKFALCEDENTQNGNHLPCPSINIMDQTPLRLGALMDMLKKHLKSTEKRQKLKPINIGDSVLNPQESTLTAKGQKPIILTEKEVMILSFLFQNHPSAITRQALLNGVWDYADGVETHTLETHIYRLRQKIEDDPTKPDFLITTEKGYGLNF